MLPKPEPAQQPTIKRGSPQQKNSAEALKSWFLDTKRHPHDALKPRMQTRKIVDEEIAVESQFVLSPELRPPQEPLDFER